MVFGIPRPREVQSVASELLVVYGAKGGVGKTFLATNLAVGFAQRGERVLLVDLDLHGNHCAVHLDLLQGPTIIDAVSGSGGAGRTSSGMAGVSRHSASGLDVLVGPAKPEQAELLDPEGIARLLQSAVETYAVVVVDTPPGGRDPLTLKALECCTGVVVITTMDAGALRQTRLGLEFLKRLDLPGTRRPRVVVNQVYAGAAVNLRQVEKFLNCRIDHALEEDRRTVEGTIFAGVPLLQGGPPGKLSGGLERMVSEIRPGSSESVRERPHGSIWGRLRGGRG
jgi:pilus assembly protein CpaE